MGKDTVTVNDVLQFIGSLAVIGMSIVSLRILIGHWFSQYGRQALIAWVATGVAVGAARFLSTYDLITIEESRTYTGVAYVVCLIYVLEIIATAVLIARCKGETNDKDTAPRP